MKKIVPFLIFLFTTACAIAATLKVPGFDAMLSTYDYPFPVKSFDFESQGQRLRMAYMDLAPEKSKTIVLMHGKNFSGFYFKRMAQDLVAKGYRVVIPDQIGFGKSSKPKGYQYSFAQLAYSTQALLKKLEVSSYTVLGHSMGGMLATRTALNYPEQVKQLILINPIGLEDYRMLAGYKTIDELNQNELKASAESIKKYQSEAYYAGQWKPEYEPLIVPAVGWTQGPDKDLLAYTSALTSDMIYNQPVVHEFKAVSQDTILVIGQRDRTAIGRAWAPASNQKLMGDYPKLGRATAKAIPRAKLVELEGLGHVPFIEDYDAFAKAFFPLPKSSLSRFISCKRIPPPLKMQNKRVSYPNISTKRRGGGTLPPGRERL